MAKTSPEPTAKKNHHALRKLVGAVAIAGATYAAEKYIESKRKKKAARKNLDIS